jgi:hypothetical protein
MAHGRQNKRNVRKGGEIMNQWSKAYLETALKCLDKALDIETDDSVVLTLYCAYTDIKNLLDEEKSEEIIDNINEILNEEELW